jgi:hypothetical protein
MMWRSKVRRILTMAVIFLACGFIANILIAWTFAALESPTHSSMYFLAAMRRHYWDDKFELNRALQRDQLWVNDARRGIGCDAIKLTADTYLNEKGLINRGAVLHIRRAGWPLRSLTGIEILDGAARMEWAVRAGEAPKPVAGVRPTLVGAENVPPMLPLKPIWPGFALNWLIVSAMLWTLWIMHLKTGRAVRRWKNRCWSCGYPTGNSDHCSECGAAITRRASTHPQIAEMPEQ